MRKLLCIFVFISQLLHAQKANPDRYTVYVNYPSYSVKAEVSTLPSKFRAIKELEYYWYYSNRIMHTQGGCEGKLLNGQFTSFYISNNLKEKGAFKQGLRNGEWISWFDNGTISETAYWKKGLKHGTVLSYNEKGELIAEANYRKGRLHGKQTGYEEGKVKSEQRFRKGKEIVQAPEKEKKKKERTEAKDSTSSFKSKDNAAVQGKQTPSLKNKIAGVFHKKEHTKENSGTTADLKKNKKAGEAGKKKQTTEKPKAQEGKEKKQEKEKKEREKKVKKKKSNQQQKAGEQ